MVPWVPDPCGVSAGCLWLLALLSPTEIILFFHSCIKSLNWSKLGFTNFETQVFDNYIITWHVIADLLLASPNFLSPSNPVAMCLDPTTALRFAIRPPSHRSPPPQFLWDRDLGWSGPLKGAKGDTWPVVDQTNGWPCFRWTIWEVTHLERSDHIRSAAIWSCSIIFTCIPDKFGRPWTLKAGSQGGFHKNLRARLWETQTKYQSTIIKTPDQTLNNTSVHHNSLCWIQQKNAIKFTQCGGLQPSATSRSTVFNNSQPTRTIKTSTKISPPKFKIPAKSIKIPSKFPLDPPRPAAAQLPRWALAASPPGAPGAPGPRARHRRARSSGRWRPVAGSWAPWAPWEKGKKWQAFAIQLMRKRSQEKMKFI